MGLAVLAVLSWVAPVAAQDAFRVGEKLSKPARTSPADDAPELEWTALMPPNWNPRQAFEGVDLASLSDNDPQANALLDKLRQDFDRAPVVKSLDGKHIRIAGFVVPLERVGDGLKEFLLVPYFGACIHTPPPPANQIIHVRTATPYPADQAIFPVWISGVLKVSPTVTAEGAAAYRMSEAKAEAYPWRRQR